MSTGPAATGALAAPAAGDVPQPQAATVSVAPAAAAVRICRRVRSIEAAIARLEFERQARDDAPSQRFPSAPVDRELIAQADARLQRADRFKIEPRADRCEQLVVVV